MTVIVDASVALKWMFVEAGSDEALKLAASGEALVAPDLVLTECANAAWKRVRRGEISAPQATAAVEIWPRWFGELLPSAELMPSALRLALDLDHPVYDCLYLAAALRLVAPLITADARLVGRVAAVPGLRVHDLARGWPGEGS